MKNTLHTLLEIFFLKLNTVFCNSVINGESVTPRNAAFDVLLEDVVRKIMATCANFGLS